MNLPLVYKETSFFSIPLIKPNSKTLTKKNKKQTNHLFVSESLLSVVTWERLQQAEIKEINHPIRSITSHQSNRINQSTTNQSDRKKLEKRYLVFGIQKGAQEVALRSVCPMNHFFQVWFECLSSKLFCFVWLSHSCKTKTPNKKQTSTS